MAKKIKIKFPNGTIKEFPKGTSGLEILKTLNTRLEKEATGIKVNDTVKGLSEPIQEDAEIKILTFDDREGRDVFWHSSAHLMAHAVKHLFPQTKFGIGPAIDDGFYYDIELDHPISPEDFDKIEAEMQKIVDENYPIVTPIVREISQTFAGALIYHPPEKLVIISNYST